MILFPFKFLKTCFKKQFAIIIALLCCTFSFSQIELKNKIVDFTTLVPIENASIFVQNTTIGTISNADGKFVLQVPHKHKTDTLVISSIGYKSFKTSIHEFDSSFEIFLEEDIVSLEEVLLTADTRPKTGNDIVLRALKNLPHNLPERPYLQKGFLRHKERNKKEFKWLIESAITLYDSSYASPTSDNLKINVDKVRKSYDLRDVDSVFTYYSYLKHSTNLRSKKLQRDTIKTTSLIKAIKWNDNRVNGLHVLFNGRLNLLRNSNNAQALFGNKILEKHQFELDTILAENDRKLYKIKILEGDDFIGLNTKSIYNEGYTARGWLYIYWDNYAIKKVEYELVAASKNQKARSKTLFDTQVNHKLVITYKDYQDKMYPNYIYYETPKLVNRGFKSNTKVRLDHNSRFNKDERFYYTIQEIMFSEIIQEQEKINEALQSKWDFDIFSPKPYDEVFWKNYNILLESEEEEKLIRDLSKRASLFKE